MRHLTNFKNFESFRDSTIYYPNVGFIENTGELIYSPKLHDSLVDAWFMSGFTNTDKPLTIRGIKNSLHYPANFTEIFDNTIKPDKITITPTVITLSEGAVILTTKTIEEGETYTTPSYRISITGMAENDWLAIGYEDITGQHFLIDTFENGIFEVPSNTFEYNSNIPCVSVILTSISNSVTITMLPEENLNKLQLNNFTFSKNSGFNKYVHNFNTWKFSNTVHTNSHKTDSKAIIVLNASQDSYGNVLECHKADYLNVPYKIKITFNSSKILELFKMESVSGTSIKTFLEYRNVKSGNILEIPSVPDNIFTNTIDLKILMSAISTTIKENIIIEQIPEYKDALVFNGIDNYLVCDTLPILNDYTIICKRVRENNNYVASKGAFTFENGGSTTSYGYSGGIIPSLNEIVYQTTTSYNGNNILKGPAVDTNSLFIGNYKTIYFLGSIYWFALYNKLLTVDEIKEEKIKLEKMQSSRILMAINNLNND